MIAFALDGTMLVPLVGVLIMGMRREERKGWMSVGILLVACLVTSMFAIVL